MIVVKHGRRLAAALAGLSLVLGLTAREASAAPSFAFAGNGYGTYGNAKLGPVSASIGRLAYLALACQGTRGRTVRTVVDGLALEALGLRSGLIESTSYTNRTALGATLTNTAAVNDVSLFGGLITATSIKAVANVDADTTTMRTSSDGSTLVGLTVAGRAVSASVAPNTRLDLPGVGRVTLRRTTAAGTSDRAAIAVDMLTIDVTKANGFGLGIGAQIVLGHAQGAITRTPGELLLNGAGWAAVPNTRTPSGMQSQLAGVAYVTLGCEGSHGLVQRNNIASVAVGKLLSIGSGEATVVGDTGDGGAYVETTASLANLNLLNGLIRADAIRSVAREEVVGSVRTRSTDGTGFVNLRVAGIPVPASVAPGTRIPVPGFGYLVLNEQILPPPEVQGRMEVTGLRLVIDRNNLLKLAVGAEIALARATGATLR